MLLTLKYSSSLILNRATSIDTQKKIPNPNHITSVKQINKVSDN